MSARLAKTESLPDYITIEQAIEAAADKPVELALDPHWIELLNSLPMVPQRIEEAVAVFAGHLPVLFTDVERAEIELQSAAFPSPRPTRRASNGRRRRTRGGLQESSHLSYKTRVPPVRTVVAEATNAHENIEVLILENEEPLAVVTLYAANDSTISDATKAVVVDVMNFVALVLSDCRARCSFQDNQPLPTIDELIGQIGDDADLTEQDCNVLNLLMRGATYIEAAHELSLSVETVKKHMKKIYDRTRTDGLSKLFARYASAQK